VLDGAVVPVSSPTKDTHELRQGIRRLRAGLPAADRIAKGDSPLQRWPSKVVDGRLLARW
jgi:hypothetical protein